MIKIILGIAIAMWNGGGDEANESWDASASGSTITVKAEHVKQSRPKNPGGAVGSLIGEPIDHHAGGVSGTGYLGGIEGLTLDRMCELYAGERRGGQTGLLTGLQISPALADYCETRGDVEEADGAPEPTMTVADLGIYIRDNAQVIINSGVLSVEPSSGEVVVNKDTYFASSASPYSANVTVLNTPLELKFNPMRYLWKLGDGTQFSTSSPGGAYPDGDVRAQYKTPGTYTPSVRISWDVAIRVVEGGAWYSVPGAAFTETIGQQVTAIEAEAVLTAKR